MSQSKWALEPDLPPAKLSTLRERGGGQKAGTWTSLKFRNYLQSMLQKANAYKRILLLSLKLCFVTLNQLLK